jgi:small subunit ribosomal protein S20
VANHPSALKRHRQSQKRRARNTQVKSNIKGRVRAVREAVASKDSAGAKERLTGSIQAIDKAVRKGALHKKAASRKVARLSKLVHEARK